MSKQLSAEQLEYFLHPSCVRERSKKLFDEVCEGKTHWIYDESKLEACVDFVIETIKTNYPTLKIPFHSRRGHLRAGNIDRVQLMRSKLKTDEKIVAEYDLIITSVFVDAGAGDEWKYQGNDGKTYSRSEGLAVASFDLFEKGLYSSQKDSPYQVDPKGLEQLTLENFAKAFQSKAGNTLLGLETRLDMMKALGKCMKNKKDFFEVNGKTRLGNLALYIKSKAKNNKIEASEILKSVLLAFEDMWPERQSISPVRFGDIWHYPNWGSTPSFESLIAFHKLSQWLSYSLMEALEDEGIKVENLDALTGLPEYRNGGLLMDTGVLTLKDKSLETKGLPPNHEAIIEWRASTVTLLDRIAELVRKKLNLTQEELPLVKVLEGGTWSAGRRAAQKFRQSSNSPIAIVSDGSVF